MARKTINASLPPQLQTNIMTSGRLRKTLHLKSFWKLGQTDGIIFRLIVTFRLSFHLFVSRSSIHNLNNWKVPSYHHMWAWLAVTSRLKICLFMFLSDIKQPTKKNQLVKIKILKLKFWNFKLEMATHTHSRRHNRGPLIKINTTLFILQRRTQAPVKDENDDGRNLKDPVLHHRREAGVIGRYEPFGKSASCDITGGRVLLDVCWIDQSTSLPSGTVVNVAHLSVVDLGGHAHLWCH